MNENNEKTISPTHSIVGFVGKKQSGKDTIAAHLVNEYGFVRYAFADPIKKACQVIFGFTDEQCWGGKKEEIDPYWNITPRKVFQIFGTELFQYEFPKYATEFSDIGRGFWVYCFARWYEQQIAKDPYIKVVITDVRFQFEADMITRLGGMIIKTVRPNQNNTDMHASEIEMDNIQYTHLLENDSTIENLYDKIDEIFDFAI